MTGRHPELGGRVAVVPGAAEGIGRGIALRLVREEMRVVSTSSVGAARAHHRGVPYDVAKGTVDAVTLAMFVDLGRHGIRVDAVAPGVTRTYRTEPHVGNATHRATESRIPMRRFGTVDDIAAAVTFLASDESSYDTGQVIHVDGGITAQPRPPGAGTVEPEATALAAPPSREMIDHR